MPSLKNIKFSYSSPPPPCIDPPPPPPPPPSSPHPPCSPCQHKNHVPPPPPAVAPPPPTYFPPPPPTIQPGTIAPPPPSTYCPPPPPTIQPGTIAPPPPSTYFPPPPPTTQPSTIAPPPRVVQPSTNAPPPRSAPNYLPPPIFAPSSPPILSSPPWGYSAPSIAPLPPPQSSSHIPLMVGTSLGGLFFLSFLVIGINYFYANKLAVPKSGGQELGPRPSRGDGGVRTTAAVPHGGGTASQLKVDNSMDAAGPTAEDIVDQGTSVPPLEKGKQLAPPSSEHKPVGDSGDPTPGKEPPPEDSQSSEKEKERERKKKAKTDEVMKSLKETNTLLTGLLQMKKLEHNELMAAHSITNKKLDPVPETLDRFQQDKAEIMPTTSSTSKYTDVENKTSIDSAEKQEIVVDGDGDDDDDAPLEDQVPEKNDVNNDKAGEVGLQENKEESEGTRSEEKTAPIAKKKKKLSRKKQPDSNRPLAEMVAKTAQKELSKIGGESEKKDNADEDVDIDDDGVGDDVAGGDEYKDDFDDDLVENKDDGQVTRSEEEKITPLNENEDGSERVETKKHGINRRDKAKKSPMRPAMKSVAFMEKVAMEDGADGKSQSKTADVENDLNKTSDESTEEQEIVGGDDDDAPLGDQKENDDVDDEAGEEEKISPADHDERDSPVAKNNKFLRNRQQPAGSNRSSTKKMTSTQKQMGKTVQNELNKSSGESEKKDTNADDGVADDDDDDDDGDDDDDDDDGEVLAELDVMGFVEGMGLSSFKKWIRIRKLVKANSRVVQELQKMDEKLRAGRKNRGVGIDEAAKAMSIGSEFMEAGESEEKITDNNDVEGETEKEHEAGEKTGENYEPPLMKRKRHVTQNMKSQKRESKTQLSQAEVKRYTVLSLQTVEGEGQGMVNEGDVMEEPDVEGDESYSGVDEEEGMQSADAANTEQQQEPEQDEHHQIMRYPEEGNDEDAVARKIKAEKHKSNSPAKTQSYSAQEESLGEADESFLQELSVAGLDMNKGMQSAKKKRNDVTKRVTSKNMKAGKSDHLNRQLQHAEAERSTITHLVKKSGKLYEQEMANNDDDEEKYQQDWEQEIMSLGKGSVARNINRSTKPPLKQPKGKKPTTTTTLNTIAQKKGISQLTNLPKLDEDNQDEEIDQPDDGDAVKQEYVADDAAAAAAEEGQSASTDAAAAEEGQSASTI